MLAGEDRSYGKSALQWVLSSATFVILGAALYLWKRPSAGDLGLRWNDAPRTERIA